MAAIKTKYSASRLIPVLLCFIFFLTFSGCQSENSKDDKLAENENLPIPPPAVDPQWSQWIKNNAISLEGVINNDSLEDLHFLEDLLQGRRIVQLGESSHGVKEYNQIKVKLIKFLHERLNFNVIAFESGIFECNYGHENIHALEPDSLMCSSIFGVWHTDEVIELFEYIYMTQDSKNPLILAGFDTQFSAGLKFCRPEFLKTVISHLDNLFANDAFMEDKKFFKYMATNSFDDFKEYVRNNFDHLESFYLSLVDFFTRNKVRVKKGDQRLFLLARQSVISTIRFLKQVISGSPENTLIRDEGMADNLDFLLDRMFPEDKIITWGHNFHFRHANEKAVEDRVTSMKSMGSWVVQRHRQELYTIGLYMYGGQATYNNKQIYDIELPLDNSLEAICNEASGDFVFIDMLHQAKCEGNSWMFSQIPTKRFGVNDQHIIPREQYDAIILIKEAHPPDYHPYISLPWDCLH